MPCHFSAEAGAMMSAKSTLALALICSLVKCKGKFVGDVVLKGVTKYRAKTCQGDVNPARGKSCEDDRNHILSFNPIPSKSDQGLIFHCNIAGTGGGHHRNPDGAPRLSLPEVLRPVIARLATMQENVGDSVSRPLCSTMYHQQKEPLWLQRGEHRLRQARCLLDKQSLSALYYG